jgi:hypothetical protein
LSESRQLSAAPYLDVASAAAARTMDESVPTPTQAENDAAMINATGGGPRQHEVTGSPSVEHEPATHAPAPRIPRSAPHDEKK